MWDDDLSCIASPLGTTVATFVASHHHDNTIPATPTQALAGSPADVEAMGRSVVCVGFMTEQYREFYASIVQVPITVPAGSS